jgi:transcriptional regulator with XRE-family HTH domain
VPRQTKRDTLEQVLARRVREIALEKGIALSHVADRAGIARSHLWAVLSARRSATLAMVQRLAGVLGVEPLALLEAGRAAKAR